MTQVTSERGDVWTPWQTWRKAPDVLQGLPDAISDQLLEQPSLPSSPEVQS
mgnify:CR=1 FL=1